MPETKKQKRIALTALERERERNEIRVVHLMWPDTCGLFCEMLWFAGVTSCPRTWARLSLSLSSTNDNSISVVLWVSLPLSKYNHKRTLLLLVLLQAHSCVLFAWLFLFSSLLCAIGFPLSCPRGSRDRDKFHKHKWVTHWLNKLNCSLIRVQPIDVRLSVSLKVRHKSFYLHVSRVFFHPHHCIHANDTHLVARYLMNIFLSSSLSFFFNLSLCISLFHASLFPVTNSPPPTN